MTVRQLLTPRETAQSLRSRCSCPVTSFFEKRTADSNRRCKVGNGTSRKQLGFRSGEHEFKAGAIRAPEDDPRRHGDAVVGFCSVALERLESNANDGAWRP